MSDEAPPTSPPTFEERTVPLDALYLDPNNSRFAGESEGPVPESRVTNPEVQTRTRLRLVDDSADMIESLRALGWLPLASVLVRALDADRYLVVEGNRRVAALKHLQHEHESTFPALRDPGRLDPGIFDALPVVVWKDPNPAQERLLEGFRHIAGARPWPLHDQARWLLTMQRDHGMTTRELTRAAGMSIGRVTPLIRAARLAELYEAGPHADRPTAALFPLLAEVARSDDLLAWLGWRDESPTPTRPENLLRLLRWLSGTRADDAEGAPASDAVLTKRDDLRQLALLLDDVRALAEIDRTRSLPRALAVSRVYAERVAEDVLSAGEAVALRLEELASRMTGDQVQRLGQLATSLRRVGEMAQLHTPLTVQGAEAWLPPFNPSVSAHFREVTVAQYRGLRDVTLPSLQRINVLAGINNSGKTTLLEAVHLLAHQHDVTGALEVVRRRGRVESRVNPRWLVEQIPHTARLSGRFDAVAGNETSVALDFARRPDVEDAAFYLGTLSLEATYGGRVQRSETLFYENRDRSTRNHGRNVLCRSALQSPFSLQDPSLLGQAYTRSVERQTRDRIVSFLRDHVDKELVSIELVDRFQRFLVKREGLEAPLDLTHFGDGMQRVFLMCLLVAFVENGVLLLDEFENAIHASVLPNLARFVHDLAKEFEVQVFLTTHSNEAIEALVAADLGEAASAYAMVRGDGGITARHFPGTTLAELIDFAGFDLRSVT